MCDEYGKYQITKKNALWYADKSLIEFAKKYANRNRDEPLERLTDIEKAILRR